MTAGLSQPVTLRGPSGIDRGRPVEAYGPSMSAPSTIQLAGSLATGVQSQVSPDKGVGGQPNSVIGVICAGDLKLHRDEIKAAISRGLSERPDAVWVCIEPRSDRMTHDVMLSLDIEPVVLPMNLEWKRKDLYDLRRLWRDLEMLHLCDELVVFQKASGHSPWRDRVKSGVYTDRLYLVEVPTVKGATK